VRPFIESCRRSQPAKSRADIEIKVTFGTFQALAPSDCGEQSLGNRQAISCIGRRSGHFQQRVTIPNKLTPAPEYFSLGFNPAYAVLFFYVISGFLITFTLKQNYTAQLGGAVEFYKNRTVRIFSLYWPLVIIVFMFLPGARDSFTSGTILDKFTNILLLGADWNLDFANYPNDNWNAVPVGLTPAWTLGAELTFYALAPYLVRHWRVVLALFCTSLLLRGILVYHLGTRIVERWTYYFAPATFLFLWADKVFAFSRKDFAGSRITD
jgi:peptidoglycan/LPS O-acetylase OafA/YrhL